MSACAIPNCPTPAKPEQLMCLRHWRMVPRALQTEVWSTWRNVRRDVESYRSARDAAVKAVVDREGGEQGSLI